MIDERRVSEYCYEDPSLIENYEKAMNDTTQTWDCHHRVETIMNCGAKELIAQGCYENRPAHDLIFLKKSEHTRLHHVGKKHSAEHRAKISKAQTGKKHSEETRNKLSAANKGKKLSEETRAKMSKAQTGKKHSEETRAKISAARKGARWFNNGIECRFCKECPGPEWKRGMLRNKQS